MDDTNQPKQAKPAAAAQPLTKLKALIEWDGTLQLGKSTYEVKKGVIEVPAWHVDDAIAAGYTVVTE